MKQHIIKLFLIAFAMATSITESAADELRYNVLSQDNRTLELTFKPGDRYCLPGDLEIPKKIRIYEHTYTVTSIGNYAFAGCVGVKNITIPNSVTSIGNNAFYNCSMTSISIPNSVTSIGNYAFAGCSWMTSISIPNSVTKIGDGAFNNCSRLINIEVDTDNPSFSSEAGVFYNKDKTTLITYPAGKTGKFIIPNSVKSIGDYAFYCCSEVTSISIPNSVTSIGNNAFDYTYSLKSIYCQWTEPFSCNLTFTDNQLKNSILYVPKGYKNAYEKVDPWRDFWNIEEIDYSAGVENVDNDEVEVKVIAGDIVVEGCETVEVYSMNGQLVYRGEAGRVENLSSGLYAVRAGGKTVKVAIAR